MPDYPDIEQLRTENEELKLRLIETEATLEAIRSGEVDALVVAGPNGHRVYTLEGADQFYRVLIEAMQPGQGAASLSLDGTILYCNHSFASMINVSQEKVRGSSFEQFIAPFDRSEWHRVLHEAQSTQIQREFLLHPKEGASIPVHLALNVLPLSGSIALGLVVTDLTERKIQEDTVRRLELEEAARTLAEEKARKAVQSETAARQSESRFRQLADALPQIVWMARADGYLDYFNKRWQEFTGFLSEGIGSDVWRPVVHPDDIGNCLARWYDSLKTGNVYEIEFRLFNSLNAGYRWHLGRAVPVRDESGRIIRWFGTCTDIDETKKAADRQRLLWEAAAILLTTEDPGSMMQKLFANIAPHFGLDCYINFLVTESGSELRLNSCLGIPPEDLPRLTRLNFGQAICGNVALHRRSMVANFIQQSEDSKTQLIKGLGLRAYACNPLIVGGKLLGTLSFASRSRDWFEADELEFLSTVTHYVTISYERLRLLKQLQETDRRKDEFLAILGHELRNPLAPIRNAAQYLKLKGESNPDLQNAREIIERQGAHLTRLVDDLLDVSRITRGKITLQKERVTLEVILTSAIESSRPAIEAAGHALIVELPKKPIYIQGDFTRLAQVFGNLLVNAAKYTDRGGEIRITARREGAEVAISISDTGIGIRPEHLNRLFEIFSQVDSALERTQGGLGIGLSLVKGLVEMHNGSVEAHSDGPGHGSQFLVRLPVLEDAEPVKANDTTCALGEEVDGKGIRILVADDNLDSVQSLSMMLSIMGYEIREAHDGAMAVEVAEEYQPEVIFMDIGMPRLNGYEAAKRIRTYPWGKSINLIALTGWGQEDDKKRADAAGFNYHFTKPVSMEALRKLLSRIASHA
ncbi:PAS domain S-box protein [Telmatocola sphagniphila]|uniref:histidine kinase n=1 Tax=Telmatocola sphagniphila TaxID=1123043 RepID=A0A8E6B123_9BACT|nr:ATP-binding protein [Telmatocola sphagniphila]QVL29940.1 PAS domain S-box protein [Telmatocola sphagniphila]